METKTKTLDYLAITKLPQYRKILKAGFADTSTARQKKNLTFVFSPIDTSAENPIPGMVYPPYGTFGEDLKTYIEGHPSFKEYLIKHNSLYNYLVYYNGRIERFKLTRHTGQYQHLYNVKSTRVPFTNIEQWASAFNKVLAHINKTKNAKYVTDYSYGRVTK